MKNNGKQNEIIEYLEKENLIDDYTIYEQTRMLPPNLYVNQNQISEAMYQMIEDGVFTLEDKNNIPIQIYTKCWHGKTYNEMLEEVGVKELKNNEVIISDNISAGTKYGENMRITNFKVGDSYTISIKGEERTFKIVGIIEDKQENSTQKYSEAYPIVLMDQFVNYETFQEIDNLEKDEWNKAELYIRLCTDKINEIGQREPELQKIIGEDEYLYINNIRDIIISTSSYANIQKVIIIAFVSLITLISVINIFNTISTSVILRKKDFAELKSIGMSNKQMRRMVTLEGIFYGIDSIFIGVLISFGILWFMYTRIVNIRLFKFVIPWVDILVCIVAVYVIIFIAIWNAKRRINKQNIIDEICEENI